MRLNSIRQLYVHELKNLYNVERQLELALQRMVELAVQVELRFALERELDAVTVHAARLERILEAMGVKGRGVRCQPVEDLISQGLKLAAECEESVRDTVLIATAERLTHYQMAAYQNCQNYALQLEDQEASRLLASTLHEEEKADRLLRDLESRAVSVTTAG